MKEKIVVPVLGESITEATVSKWLKNEGDSVEADEPIVELETDKVNLEVPSPINGVLTEINSKDGTTVEVGALLGSVSENDAKETDTEIKKLDPSKEVKKLDPSKEVKDVQEKEILKNEPEIFEPTNLDEKPLILTMDQNVMNIVIFFVMRLMILKFLKSPMESMTKTLRTSL